jgi:hypothetical protein
MALGNASVCGWLGVADLGMEVPSEAISDANVGLDKFSSIA